MARSSDKIPGVRAPLTVGRRFSGGDGSKGACEWGLRVGEDEPLIGLVEVWGEVDEDACVGATACAGGRKGEVWEVAGGVLGIGSDDRVKYTTLASDPPIYRQHCVANVLGANYTSSV